MIHVCVIAHTIVIVITDDTYQPGHLMQTSPVDIVTDDAYQPTSANELFMITHTVTDKHIII